MAPLLFTLFIQAALLPLLAQTYPANVKTCRSYCGNITVDYPFALEPGCGHPGFRDLVFCINDFLMLHISSGSYRVLGIDYAYRALTLHDPHLSTCDSIVLGARGNGFVVEQQRSPYLAPAADNVFLLIGCSARSPLFQGFPGKHLPCRNVSGMGCEEYYGCPAWDIIGPNRVGSAYGLGPPDCCGVAFEAIRAINLTKLECQGYSSAYSVAPLRVGGPGGWSYGIRVKYSLPGNEVFCRACQATGGSCGYEIGGANEVCMCGSWNSTSNCDSVHSSSSRRTLLYQGDTIAGFFICMIVWMAFDSVEVDRRTHSCRTVLETLNDRKYSDFLSSEKQWKEKRVMMRITNS